MRHSITMGSSLMHVSLVLTILDLKHQVLVSLSISFHKNLKVQAMPFIIDIYFFIDGGRYFASFAPIGSTGYQCVPLLEAFMNLRGPYSQQYNVHYE